MITNKIDKKELEKKEKEKKNNKNDYDGRKKAIITIK